MAQNITTQEWETCISVLMKLKDHPELAHDEMTLKGLVVKLHKQARKRNRKKQELEAAKKVLENFDEAAFAQTKTGKKKTAKEILKAKDQKAKESTFIFQRNDDRVTEIPELLTEGEVSKQKLHKTTRCYVCKNRYKDLHFFYHMLCPDCAQLNFEKRNQKTDLTNRVVLLTGGRIKIGFELCLKMLRDGATVILTSRFPNDTQRRYKKMSDYAEWADRLHIFGLDLRNIPQLEQFIEHLYQSFDYLDIIINNAAQTIKRPLAFYQHLLEGEQTNYLLNAEKEQNQLALYAPYFPANQYDKDEQQIDLRPENSWVAKLDKVDTREMLEVQLVNVTAPFLLNSRLKNLLLKSPFKKRFIVNVSAMEGQFYRKHKTVFHPHTNMAKAALNMMTRTSAADYAEDGIFMTSVDTGWITNENPHPKKEQMRDNQHFVPPIDCIDGAARVYDPIVTAINDPETGPLFGSFLKDYGVVSW